MRGGSGYSMQEQFNQVWFPVFLLLVGILTYFYFRKPDKPGKRVVTTRAGLGHQLNTWFKSFFPESDDGIDNSSISGDGILDDEGSNETSGKAVTSPHKKAKEHHKKPGSGAHVQGQIKTSSKEKGNPSKLAVPKNNNTTSSAVSSERSTSKDDADNSSKESTGSKTKDEDNKDAKKKKRNNKKKKGGENSNNNKTSSKGDDVKRGSNNADDSDRENNDEDSSSDDDIFARPVTQVNLSPIKATDALNRKHLPQQMVAATPSSADVSPQANSDGVVRRDTSENFKNAERYGYTPVKKELPPLKTTERLCWADEVDSPVQGLDEAMRAFDERDGTSRWRPKFRKTMAPLPAFVRQMQYKGLVAKKSDIFSVIIDNLPDESIESLLKNLATTLSCSNVYLEQIIQDPSKPPRLIGKVDFRKEGDARFFCERFDATCYSDESYLRLCVI